VRGCDSQAVSVKRLRTHCDRLRRHGASGDPAPAENMVLIGPEDKLASPQALLDDVGAGGASRVIRDDPGIKKSALADEFGRLAHYVDVVARAGHMKSSRRCRMYSATDCAGRPVRSSTSWVKRLYRSSRCSLAMVAMCCWVCGSSPTSVRCSSHSS
jgi:hypothetical protein